MTRKVRAICEYRPYYPYRLTHIILLRTLQQEMSLPQPLRITLLPDELEFIASEEIVVIKPTIKMDRIRFISVSFPTRGSSHHLQGDAGYIWTFCRRSAHEGAVVDRSEPKAQEEM